MHGKWVGLDVLDRFESLFVGRDVLRLTPSHHHAAIPAASRNFRVSASWEDAFLKHLDVPD